MAGLVSLPPPYSLGVPNKFKSWRPLQDRSVLDLVDTERRFLTQNQPTGSGKTLAYIAGALLSGKRTLILTSLKGLQNQLMLDFGVEPGLVKVMGKNAYRCKISPRVSCDYGPCSAGMRCNYRVYGCEYYSQIALAKEANIVLTNYSFWIKNKPDTLGKFDLLICDEAHNSIQHLLDSLAVTIYKKELKQLGVRWPAQWDDYWEWLETLNQAVVKFLKNKVNQTHQLIKNIKEEDFRIYHKLKQKTQDIVGKKKTQWVTEYTSEHIAFDPLWPPEFSEEHLFRGIPKIVFVSATINKKLIELLGVDNLQHKYIEYPSHFPIYRRPIIHVPTARVDHRIGNSAYNLWLTRIDQIISQRLDRKGIIHTVSYERRNRITRVSEYSDIFYTHQSKDIQGALSRFKNAPSPAVLCSPSVVTGWDFPYEECEYQIVGKIPFPDMRREVDKERRKRDKDFGCCFAMQNLVQACGRGMRNNDDQCECLIIDDHFTWFIGRYRHFAPKWFIEAVKYNKTIPKPLTKLRRRIRDE